MTANKIKYITIMSIMSINILYGSTYSLSDIATKIETNSYLEQSLSYKKASLESMTMSETASVPINLNLFTNRAKPNGENSGMEYQVGLSKNIKIGNTNRLDRDISNLANEATLIESSKQLISMSNGVKNLYHQSCLDTKSYQTFELEYTDFAKIYNKKRKAYRYGEISKLELMQLDMEYAEMNRRLDEKRAREQTSKDLIIGMASLEPKAQFQCSDVYPIKSKIDFGGEVFSLTRMANEKRIGSNLNVIERYSKSIDTFDISSFYISELTQEKYGLGVSIPLSFTSAKNEYKKASAMYQNSELESAQKHIIKEKVRELEKKLYDIKIDYQKVEKLNENIRYYRTKLLPLIKKSYDYGESSAIEYLNAKQKLYVLQDELYTTQKRYYESLFGLYDIVETKGK